MDEYVQCAIDRGLKLFGFSDHTPHWFPGDYYSIMRMYPDQLHDYCDEVRALQKAYAGRIEIPLGLEVEYYPALHPELMSRIKDAGVEYLLLGQHRCGNEEGEPYNGAATEDVALLERYCNQVIEAMHTGLFTYLAHPDLIHFVGEKKTYRQHIRRLCQAANETDTPLEINLLGIRYQRNYPRNDFWALAAEEGCKVVIGIDAHKPEDIQDLVPEQQALEIVRTYGLELLPTVPLKKIN
jgi:histidinol-phosphatase (PHP family)